MSAINATGALALRSYDEPELGQRSGTGAGPRQVALTPAVVPGGVFATQFPVSMLSETFTGAFQEAFFDSYFNRIYLLPPRLDLGAVAGTVSQSVLVWNAYLSGKQFTAAAFVGLNGVALTGLNAGQSFFPLATRTATVIVSESGSPQIDGAINFSFSGGATARLSVTGTRAQVSPFAPNWGSPFVVEYQFKTDVIASRAGREQRRALRDNYRKRMAFESHQSEAALRKAFDHMVKRHNIVMLLPEWPYSAPVSAAVVLGANSVTLEATAPPWAAPGAYAALGVGEAYEVLTILSVAGNVVTFTTAVASAWPVSAKLRPVRSGRLAAEMSARAETNELAVVSVEFESAPLSENDPDPPPAPASFDGRELFAVKPNWAGLPSITFESQREDVDFGRGSADYFTPVRFPTRLTELTFNGLSRDKTTALIDFFRRAKGQRGEFYAPTWQADIKVKMALLATQNFLRVAGREFEEIYRDSTVHRAVYLQLKSGVSLALKVQSFGTVDDSFGQDSTIILTTAFASTINVSDIKQVSWLLLCRHATDTLTVDWLTDTVSQMRMTFRSLEALPT